MEAQEVDIILRIDAERDILSSLTSILKVKGPTDLTPRDLPVVPDALQPTTATRDTLATDFPVGGNYILQLVATFSGGKLLKSAERLLHVGTGIEETC